MNDNTETAQSEKINKNVDSSKAADTLSSPNRQSTSPSRTSHEKRTSSDSKGKNFTKIDLNIRKSN